MLRNQYKRPFISGILIIICSSLIAQTPVVSNVWFEQRTDGSLIVDIYYDVTSAGGLPLEVFIEASDDDGITWDLPCTNLTGEIGDSIFAGTNKHVVWDFYADNPDTSGNDYRVRVTADCMVCGQIIMENYTLTEDILCARIDDLSEAIKIGAPNITFDLGGHTISGDLSKGFMEGIIVDKVDGITIKNGTIEGFGNGIIIGMSNNSTIENLTIRNLDAADPEIFTNGIVADQCKDVIIRDCQFEFLPVAHKEAVVMGLGCDFTVDNIEFYGGSVGVNFGGGEDPSNGSVINSRFIGVTIAGILVQNGINGLIKNNVFTENEVGISADSENLGDISGLTIEGNDIHDGFIGIIFRGIINSFIKDNFVNNNAYRGIAFEAHGRCQEEPYNNCFFSTGNIITNNVVRGNGIDLYHHEKCVGNTWEGNTCITNHGAEIPDCNPIKTTAQEALVSVDSVAKETTADAQLILVNSWNCDTLGDSHKWYYIYKSVSQQKDYEFWFNDGQVIERDSVSIPWMVGEGNQHITESWIDSDSAMVIAEGLGGKEFREEFEIENIEMSLLQSTEPIWNIFYIS
ncbi:right-handed parallel beta-helix repeat-containing protein, partial [Bacteroidota bacterium]